MTPSVPVPRRKTFIDELDEIAGFGQLVAAEFLRSALLTRSAPEMCPGIVPTPRRSKAPPGGRRLGNREKSSRTRAVGLMSISKC